MTSITPYDTEYPSDNLSLFLNNNTNNINVANSGDTYIIGNFYTPIIEAVPISQSGTTVLNIGTTSNTTQINLGSLLNNIPITVNNAPLSLKNVGTAGSETLVSGETLVTGYPQTFSTKGIKAGTGISFATNATDITITNTSSGDSVSLASAGGDETLVNDGIGPALVIKGLTAGVGVSLAGSGDSVTIASSVTLANSGVASGFISLLDSTTSPNFTTKGINLGVSNGLTLTATTTDITLGLPTTADVILNSLTTGSSGNMGITLATGTTVTGNVIPTVTATNTLGTSLKTYLSSNIDTMNTTTVVVKNAGNAFATTVTSATLADQPLVLPSVQGVAGAVLTNNGSGTTSWVVPSDSSPNQDYGGISSGSATTSSRVCTRYYQIYSNYSGTISDILLYISAYTAPAKLRVGIYRGTINLTTPSATLVAQSAIYTIPNIFSNNIPVVAEIGQNLTFAKNDPYIVAVSVDKTGTTFVSTTGNSINQYSYINSTDSTTGFALIPLVPSGAANTAKIIMNIKYAS